MYYDWQLKSNEKTNQQESIYRNSNINNNSNTIKQRDTFRLDKDNMRTQKDYTQKQYNPPQLDSLLHLKYPIYSLAAAISLNEKIKEMSSHLQSKLKEQLRSFGTYRSVRGDGNCFVRAMGYIYFCIKSDYKIQTMFPYLNQISMVSCEPIPKGLQIECYKDQILKGVLKDRWEVSLRKQLAKYQNYRTAYVSLLMEQPYFDVLIVLYIRAVLAKYVNDNQEELKNFIQDNKEEQIKRILAYGQQSEGLALQCCQQLLGTKITIYQLRADKIQSYKYGQDGAKYSYQSSMFGLFYHNKHYDIVEKYTSYQTEKSLLKRKESSYYSQINIQTINGECCACGRSDTIIYADTLTCQECTQQAKKLQIELSAGQDQSGICIACQKQSHKLSSATLLCPSCNEYQIKLQKDYSDNNCIKCARKKNYYGKCYYCDQNYCNLCYKIKINNKCINCQSPIVPNRQQNILLQEKCKICRRFLKSNKLCSYCDIQVGRENINTIQKGSSSYGRDNTIKGDQRKNQQFNRQNTIKGDSRKVSQQSVTIKSLIKQGQEKIISTQNNIKSHTTIINSSNNNNTTANNNNIEINNTSQLSQLSPSRITIKPQQSVTINSDTNNNYNNTTNDLINNNNNSNNMINNNSNNIKDKYQINQRTTNDTPKTCNKCHKILFTNLEKQRMVCFLCNTQYIYYKNKNNKRDINKLDGENNNNSNNMINNNSNNNLNNNSNNLNSNSNTYNNNYSHNNNKGSYIRGQQIFTSKKICQVCKISTTIDGRICKICKIGKNW